MVGLASAKSEVQSGFTLIELMVTLAVFGILSAVGVPAMHNYLTNKQSDGLLRQLISDLNYARDHAITHRTAVVIEPDDSWSEGWNIRESNSSVSLRQADTPDNTDISADFSGSLSFNAFGIATGSGALTVQLDGCSGSRVYLVSVSISGQTTVESSDCP